MNSEKCKSFFVKKKSKEIRKFNRKTAQHAARLQGNKQECRHLRRVAARKKPQGYEDFALRYKYRNCYDSFSTWTFTSAVTSRKIFTVTGYSPRALMGSLSWSWRLSILKFCAARASAMSPEVTEPKSWSFSPVLRVKCSATPLTTAACFCAASSSVAVFLARELRMRSRAFMLPLVASMAILRGSRKLRA